MPSASNTARVQNSRLQVAILLATKNGARYLIDQLRSYEDQTFNQWSLHVSDDGSTDNTVEILQQFARSCAQVKSLRQGPQRGHTENFLSLAQDTSIIADYFSFSDQDDIWYPDKIERALSFLTKIPQSTPALYFARTEIVDENLNHLGFSPLFTRRPSFQNALIQNIGGGNTIVFNSAAKRLLEVERSHDVATHDWWTYQVVTAVGGIAIYDKRPSLKYRQHSGNVLGSNSGMRARIKRFLGNDFQRWNEDNTSALSHLSARFTDSNRETLDRFIESRNTDFPVTKLLRLYQSGVYRQTVIGNLALVAACVLRKI